MITFTEFQITNAFSLKSDNIMDNFIFGMFISMVVVAAVATFFNDKNKK